MATRLPVVILAGGLATRLRPLTDLQPKALVDVAGEPFIVHQLRLLARNAVTRVVICAGYRGEMIEDYLGREAFGIALSYAYDGPRLLGTAGALAAARPLIGADAFFALYGDSYLPCDYGAVQRAFERSGRPAQMTVYRNEGRWDTSNVEFADGRIITYSKRARTQRMNYIDYGIGILTPRVLDGLPPGKSKDLAVLYEGLAASNELAAFEVSDRFYEIGSPAGLAELHQYLIKQGSHARSA
jgi:NDP-sugar pyrophosphorylase family protein